MEAGKISGDNLSASLLGQFHQGIDIVNAEQRGGRGFSHAVNVPQVSGAVIPASIAAAALYQWRK